MSELRKVEKDLEEIRELKREQEARVAAERLARRTPLHDQYEDLYGPAPEAFDELAPKLVKFLAKNHDKYKYFAEKFRLRYENDLDLLQSCHEKHQDNLLDGYHHDEPSTHCEDGCTGWYYNNRRCDCGNFKGWGWNDKDWNKLDPEEFNLDSTTPVGWAQQQW